MRQGLRPSHERGDLGVGTPIHSDAPYFQITLAVVYILTLVTLNLDKYLDEIYINCAHASLT